jgi:ABC-type multidrug transport system fused ATPase/permease subunit
VHEIHIHGAANYERADISERLGLIFKIRFDLYQKKFVAKFWNNILSQATPFAIYLVGGYFAITGQMDVGAVVGVLLAYKDLPSPIKELIDWDQQRQDVQIKYEQVIDQFQPEGMMPPELQGDSRRPTAAARQGAGAGRGGRDRGWPREAARQPVAHPADQQSGGRDRQLGLGQGSAGAGAGAADSAGERIDPHRRQGFLPAAGICHRRAAGLCRAGHLPLPALPYATISCSA